jgi:hypothetical protein
MTYMRQTFLLLVVTLFFFLDSAAQSISNVRAETVEDSVRISYQLNDPAAERTYSVAVVGILDNDTLELEYLRGDIGDSIRAGSHEVWWNFVAEMGRYKGSISFQVLALPDFYITSPDTGQVIKTGKPITLQWYGGDAQNDTLLLELYNYENRLDSIGTAYNATQYKWEIPNKYPPNEGYRIKVTGPNPDRISHFTNEFTIKRAYPRFGILVPPVLVAGGLVWGILTDWWKLPKPLDPDKFSPSGN